ncbi:hypothetical protein D3C73_1353180 [compost metagenome]
MLAQIPEQIRLELIATTAQGRTQQLHALGQHLRQVQFRLAPPHQADQNPTAIGRHQFQVKRCVVAAHRVENDIERPQVAQAVQVVSAHHAALGAERFTVGQALGRADTDPARIAERLAQLNGS